MFENPRSSRQARNFTTTVPEILSQIVFRTYIFPKIVVGCSCREEKSFRQVAMVAKFLDDNKPKTSLIKRIRTVSNFDDLIQFHLICQMMAKFSGA